MDWQQIRALLECFTWRDEVTGVAVSGHNPPKGAKELRRKPVFVRYITKSGTVEQGTVVGLKTFTRQHQRLVQFVESQQIRRICDILIIEIDGIRIVAG